MPGLIIEQITGGTHRAFHRADHLPFRIGRAFDNDLILQDPFVSPHHLIIAENDEGWTVTDCGSFNGSRREGALLAPSATVQSGDRIHLGETTIVLWSSECPVEEALPLRPPPVQEHRSTAPVSAAIGSSFLVTLAILADTFLDTTTETRALSYLAKMLPVLFMPLLWAGVWSTAGFIARRRGSFLLQLTAANLALVAMVLIVEFSAHIGYVTSNILAGEITQYVAFAALLSGLFIVNLRISLGAASRRRNAIAAIIGTGLVSVFALGIQAQRMESTISPVYSTALRPPYAKIVGSIELEKFIAEGENLFGEIR